MDRCNNFMLFCAQDKLKGMYLNMEIDHAIIEEYILLGYKPKKNTKLRKNLLVSGIKPCVIAMLIALGYNMMMLLEIRDINATFTNVLSAILIPFTAWFTLILCKKGLKRMYKHETEKVKEGKRSTIAFFSTLGVVMGYFGIRPIFRATSDVIVFMIVGVLIALLIQLCVFIASVDFYKVYLLDKYCPHLRNKIVKNKPLMRYTNDVKQNPKS